MIFTIFEVSQLHSAIYAVVQGAVVSCLQHQELGCLPESLCWLQAPSLSMFPVITSVNEDRCTMLSLQGAYKGDIGSPLLGREHCGMAQGHLACHGTTVPLLPALLGPALGLLRHLRVSMAQEGCCGTASSQGLGCFQASCPTAHPLQVRVPSWVCLAQSFVCDFGFLFIQLDWLTWSEHGANNVKVTGLIPVWDQHLRVGLKDPCGSIPTQNFL